MSSPPPEPSAESISSPRNRRRERRGGGGRRSRFLQQAVGEHDLDDRGNRLGARPVALQLAGERYPADRLRVGLDDPLESGAMGFWRRAADRVDDGIDLVALTKRVEGR